MNAELDTANLIDYVSRTWSDYDGDEVYGDFTVSGNTATNVRSFEPSIGRVDPHVTSGSSNTNYYHSDLLGTTRYISDSSGSTINPMVFTAFGEPIAGTVDGGKDRFGYVGAHGYQAHGEFPFLHVGARYYDPSSGRFLQRDAIGIEDDWNVYGYVGELPTILIDPTGNAYNHKSFRISNSGRLRFGPSRPMGAPPSVRRPALRFPGKHGPHIWGRAGAGVVGGLCLASAGAGALAGRTIDNAHGNHNNGFRISDGLADLIFHWRHGSVDYNPWGP